ncbi:ATP-binding protein [Actinocatenispora comari]|uniref:HTH luxR-type domain-containing protein n=1 Tax=Actinocatenispora comari TaxID=2807577 RepID=A0A8J4A8A8_9ACTN|nr:AAA family ATPase [Actinocatenispora comari]GIL25534.1 hypothetical protein NUM_07890 [Actinocatenispora comari]
MSDIGRSVALPLDYGPLIGRAEDEQRAVSVLSRNRLVTLTGTGGVGKTRLAIRVARRIAESMPGGAWMVELAALPQQTTVEQLWTSIARGVQLYHQQSGLDVVARHLSGHAALLVLDNCEHLMAAVREAVTALLAAVPTLRILATSRQPLHLPEAGEHVLDLAPLPTDDAVAVFLAYAHAGGSTYAPLTDGSSTDADAPQRGSEMAGGLDLGQVATLVDAVDGLPLAVEIISRWAATMRLDELIEAVTTNPWEVVVDLDPSDDRHSTLRRIYDWSWLLCSSAEQLVWQWISLFPKATDLPTIVDVCTEGGLDRLAVARAVEGLRDKRILTADLDHTGTPRLGLLATARAYAAEHLATSGHAPAARAAYRGHYRARLAHAATHYASEDEIAILRTVNDDLDHIKTAVDYALADADLATARALVTDMTRTRAPFLFGWLGTARVLTDRVLDAGGPDTVATADEALQLAAAMAGDAWITLTQGATDRAFELITNCYQLHKQWHLDPSPPLLYADGAARALGLSDPDPQTADILTTARTALDGDPASCGDRLMVTLMWSMALSALNDPRAEDAASIFLADAQAAGSPWTESWAQWDGAFAALVDGRYEQANERCRRALMLMSDIGDVWGLTWALLMSAAISADSLDAANPSRRQARRAAWLAAAAQHRRDEIGVRIEGLAPLAAIHNRILTRVSEVLDTRALNRALTDGRRRYHYAVEYALADRLPRRPTPSSTLTQRQHEVAQLMLPDASGHRRTDRDIATELGISVRTAEAHVGDVLRLLGLSNRKQLRPDHLTAAPTAPTPTRS